MKRWIVPLVCALAGHLLLFTCDPGRRAPSVEPPARRSVTISLVTPPPAPKRTVAPLTTKAPPSVEPLQKLTPPPPPAPAPPPVEPPKPTPRAPAEPPLAPAAPQPTPPPESSDEAEAPTDHSTTTEATAATQDVEPSHPAPDPVEVQASVPLYHLNPPPDYPTLARRRQYEGTVLLNVRVDIEGNAAEVQIARSSGHAVLDRSAVAAVERWRFEPARRLDRPVEMWVQVPVRFALQ